MRSALRNRLGTLFASGDVAGQVQVRWLHDDEQAAILRRVRCRNEVGECTAVDRDRGSVSPDRLFLFHLPSADRCLVPGGWWMPNARRTHGQDIYKIALN
ncbi:unnamed protein product (mitochondrion) [Plasmodiophora brassicae]|uniref:Uncharacterized protein n=1 Tax=Plasmodiophora brassicae TaxID=37360 RepID=A0A3P3YFV8_PLABS|nr:unnamed protein product [Plasmodiophora brassicae]